MKVEDVRLHYQQRCVLEFRTAIILGIFLWLLLIPATLCVFAIGVIIFRVGLRGIFHA